MQIEKIDLEREEKKKEKLLRDWRIILKTNDGN